MTHEDLALMGWQKKELEPTLSPVVFLCSWSLIPLAIGILMFSFDKYTDYLFHACMSAIVLQILSIYLVFSKNKIAMQYGSIRYRLMAIIIVLFIFIVVQLSQIKYGYAIQISLTLIFSYISLSSIQLFANNLGSSFEHSWSTKQKLSSHKLQNWNIQSYLFSNDVMAIRTFKESNCIAWISGRMKDDELKLVVDIFGHHPKDEFDFSSLQIDLKNKD